MDHTLAQALRIKRLLSAASHYTDLESDSGSGANATNLLPDPETPNSDSEPFTRPKYLIHLCVPSALQLCCNGEFTKTSRYFFNLSIYLFHSPHTRRPLSPSRFSTHRTTLSTFTDTRYHRQHVRHRQNSTDTRIYDHDTSRMVAQAGLVYFQDVYHET